MLHALVMADVRDLWFLLWPLLWLVGAVALTLMILIALAWYPVVGLVLGVSLVWIGVRRALAPQPRSTVDRQ
jgi:predicted phage tail protein